METRCRRAQLKKQRTNLKGDPMEFQQESKQNTETDRAYGVLTVGGGRSGSLTQDEGHGPEPSPLLRRDLRRLGILLLSSAILSHGALFPCFRGVADYGQWRGMGLPVPAPFTCDGCGLVGIEDEYALYARFYKGIGLRSDWKWMCMSAGKQRSGNRTCCKPARLDHCLF